MKSKLKLKRPGRKRRTLGWTLLTLGLLVAAVWVASGWWGAYYGWPSGMCGICAGMFDLRNGYVLSQGWNANPIGGPVWEWWQGVDLTPGPNLLWRQYDMGPVSYGYQTASDGGGLVVLVNFWPIPLLLWTPGVLLLRSGILARRRATQGMCGKCGYSLAGLGADSKCPECGKGAGTK